MHKNQGLDDYGVWECLGRWGWPSGCHFEIQKATAMVSELMMTCLMQGRLSIVPTEVIEDGSLRGYQGFSPYRIPPEAGNRAHEDIPRQATLNPR